MQHHHLVMLMDDMKFKKVEKKNKRKNKNKFFPIHYKKKLFTSNCRPFIMLSNGLQTDIPKGSDKERMFWHVKDSSSSPSCHYYFDSPDDAERTLGVQYSTESKQIWNQRLLQFRAEN